MGKDGSHLELSFSTHVLRTGSRADDGFRRSRPPPLRQRSFKVNTTSKGSSLGSWSSSSKFPYTLLVIALCLIGSISSMSVDDELACPAFCRCSHHSPAPHSITWMSPAALLSIDCSNTSVDDLLEITDTLFSPETTDNVTSPGIIRKYHIHVLDASSNMLENAMFAKQHDGNVSWLVIIDKLDLSRNFISNISAGDNCLLDSVLSLDLSFNHIERLDDIAIWHSCPGLQSLRKMNLRHNSIKDVKNTSFSSLAQLRSLDLSFNQLQIISSASFGGLVSMQYLSISSNNLSRITDVFPHLPDLTSLDLSNNVLATLPKDVFSRLNSLKELNLANNKITYLGVDTFMGLNHLNELSISHNPIVSLDKPVFQGTSLLRLSMISMPQLTNISHDVFSGLNSLIYLNMSNNQKLHFLQPSIFSPITSLQILDISHCGFQQLSSTTFRNIGLDLHQVYLKGSPLNCDCTNAWLVDEREKVDSVFVDANTTHCIERNQVVDIATADFQCQQVLINSTEGLISIRLGSKLMLQCQQVSTETAVLMWTTPSGQKLYHHDFHPLSLSHLFSPSDVRPHSQFHKDHYWHQGSSYHDEISSRPDRILVLTDGSLYIDYMLRSDTGEYTCKVDNTHYNHSIAITLHLQYDISGRIKIVAFVVGFLCAISFFTLNVIYVIITWIARRLVNKRRREIILQMLENLNSYKSVQVSRVHENYLHQLNRVRNQYHVQRDRLHNNYTGQVTKVKRGCSNQVERIRDNYHSKLTQLGEYSSKQIMQIREGANNQIGRIRDYASVQLEKVRETYKLQQQHVLKLLDTMNLDNCRSVVETECMRTESMMFDIDLLEPDERFDSPISPNESDYDTANSSPTASDRFTLQIDDSDNSDNEADNEADDDDNSLIYTEVENSGADKVGQRDDLEIEMELNTSLALPRGVRLDAREVWKYNGDKDEGDDHVLYTHVYDPNEPKNYHSHQATMEDAKAQSDPVSILDPLPQHTVTLDHNLTEQGSAEETQYPQNSEGNDEDGWSGNFVTPEASPIKLWDNGKIPDEDKVGSDDNYSNNERLEESEL